MQVQKKGLVIFACLFAVLLIVHSAFTFYHKVAVKEYADLITLPETVTTVDAEVNVEPTEGFSNKTAAHQNVISSLATMTLLEVLMVMSGLPLLFLAVGNITQSHKKLNKLTREIEESNKAFIFNSMEKIEYKNEEEVKARLLTNLKKVREFIKAISSGNYGINWEGINEENKESNRESIAGALLHMRNQMEHVKEQDQIRIWTTEGLSKFGEIIRNHQDNIGKLSENLVSNVVNYVGAKVGGLFILEEDEKNEKFLQLRASYAYERKKYIAKKILIGEGIIGQCYLEGHTIYMAKVPDNYVSITSGLGGANPNSLLVIPLKTNDKIEGVLELASLKPFQPHEIEFLEKLGELLASSIVTVRTSEKTTHLLRISQEQSEEMRAQEEEMRQNMEELEATQEQMNRTVAELGSMKANLEKEKYLLDSLMDTIPDSIYFKDLDSKFIRVSKYLANRLNANVEDLIGKSDFDFQDKTHAKAAFDDEQNIMKTKQPKIDYVEQESADQWVSTTKMPLINQQGLVVGTFGISRDVSKLKKLESDVVSRDKSFKEEKKLYEQKIKILEEKLKNYENENTP